MDVEHKKWFEEQLKTSQKIFKRRIDWESIVLTPIALLWAFRWPIVILILGIYLISKL